MNQFFKQFGARPTKAEIRKLQESPNWGSNEFQNLIPTAMSIGLKDMPSLLKKQFTKRKEREPTCAIPIHALDQKQFLNPSVNQAQFVWYGHSVLLIRIQGKTLLIDPMFGEDAAPIAPFKARRYSENTIQLVDSLPKLDAVMLTHDHYDHLDLDSIEKIEAKTKHFYTPLGCARHLQKWGITSSRITELDWWNEFQIDSLRITFTPTRHFSGRGLFDRSKSLWGGWVIKSPEETVYFSGDSGYGPHFKEIGEKLGPFDIGFMECGQYYKLWQALHMMPEESVQAAIDAKVSTVIPVHWGGFTLSLHSWTDPVERFKKEALKQEQQSSYPYPGQLFKINELFQKSWWNEYMH